ncbi:MAG: iron ABC transporter permease [Proteobacteria bacterium]|jgi:ABC-type Fe3+ transport system, permease component|nr:MAG: iron ABC transporter permease [Pseudomonadota bacterium]
MTGVPRAIASWRARQRVSPSWTALVALILALMMLPVITISVLALAPTENIWPHLASTVLPRSVKETVLLMLGVGVLTLVIGTATAWFVTMYRFPGRVIVDRLLVIPLAMPTYIVAYCYGDLFDYAGPIQTWLRAVFGWTSARDYWFPEIRSLTGGIFVLSMVLYPYVYLTARASFVQQSVCVLEVARTLGRTALGTFWSVALPLARPALAAGVALALMECLNDLGAVQYLGIETLTISVYTTWLHRSNLGGAAQLAAVILFFVVVLFAAERIARGSGRFHHTTGRYRSIPFSDVEGWRGYVAALICLLPFVLGFLVPFGVLLSPTLRYASEAIDSGFWQTAWNSVMLSAIAALLAVLCALLLAYAQRVTSNKFTRTAVQIAGLGYAIPGTVLALGLLIPLATFDNMVDALARGTFGVSTGLLLSGSVAALVLAYTIRFLAVSLGSVEAGLQRISPNLDAAARTLGQSSLSTLWRVHMPLLVPALGAGGLLVFVDSMKELPATLLLRPFNFETLATQVYNFAVLEQFEHAAPGALTIVAVGLIPVLLLHRAVAGGRAGTGSGP